MRNNKGEFATKSTVRRDGNKPVRAKVQIGNPPVRTKPLDEHEAWLAKYEPFERKVFAERARRLANRGKYKRLDLPATDPYNKFADTPFTISRFFDVYLQLYSLIFMEVPFFLATEVLRKHLTAVIDNYRKYLRRPLYYAQENARRQALAEQRRKIRRRTTINACPTKEQILEAYLAVKTSHEAVIRFGSLIEDLECYLDNSLRRDEKGEIVGRNPGIKGWLAQNIPALYLKYTTVMRYKATAKKLRQITELRDPTPAAAIFDILQEEPSLAVARARAIWNEVIDKVAQNPTSLIKRINDLLDPERIEETNMLLQWRQRYENEITERSKLRWWKKERKKHRII